MTIADPLLVALVIGLSTALGAALALLREREPLGRDTRTKPRGTVPAIWRG